MLNTGLTTVQHWTLTLSQVKSLHTLTPYSSINLLHIILPSLVISSPQVFRLIFYRYFWSIPMRATSTYYIILNFMTLIISGKEYTLSCSLTLRRLISYIYIYIYIYMEHPFLMFLDHTQRRSTVGRTPLDE